MRWETFHKTAAALALLLLPSLASPVRANITIEFNYSLDTGGFFTSNPQAQTLLDTAAQQFESRFADSLLGITPGSGNTWTAISFNPSNVTTDFNLVDLTIAANTVVIYVGGANISALGLGGPGGFSTSGFSNWNDIVLGRGNAGAIGNVSQRTDFAPWGGSIAFSANATWYFDSNPATSDVPSGQNDFYSVALHELAHALGFGTADSWFNHVAPSNAFNGTASTLVNGGVNPALFPDDDAHWFPGTTSVIMDTAVSQEAAMDPNLTVGTRKEFTLLDFAGMKDIGWQVAIPEPSAWPFATAALLGGALYFRRRHPPPAKT